MRDTVVVAPCLWIAADRGAEQPRPSHASESRLRCRMASRRR